MVFFANSYLFAGEEHHRCWEEKLKDKGVREDWGKG